MTPLKPSTKASVSLEAIQTCLYYLHVETAEDEILRSSLEAERLAEQHRPPQHPVLRKPLPPTPFANYPASQRPSTPPKSYPHHQPPGSGTNGATQVERYTSRGSHLRLNFPNHGSVSRKPLGARALPSQQVSSENVPASAHLKLRSVATDEASRRWSVPDRKPAPRTPRLEIPEQPEEPSGNVTVEDLDNEWSNGHADETGPTGTTNIALIRRDPTSGVQWNVGSIKAESRRHGLALLQPVEVTITSPGYSRFCRTQGSSSTPDTGSPDSPTSGSPKTSFFRRRLGFRPLPDQYRPSLQHVRVNSGDFLSDITHTPVKKVRQVYSFTSPWQGVCTFSNGVDGKSLRLKHSLPTHASTEPDAGVTSAELRFNLPWSVLRLKDSNRQPGLDAEKLPISQLLAKSKAPKDQWRRSVQTLKSRKWTSRPHASTISEGQPPLSIETANDDSDEESRISLKLGREKAGGGFKGKSAKLGKLILEDEGLKMCDLTVAACMGVWWQHYMDST